ncbi:MAG: hypothetical protein HFG64_09745 [Lachnospiraceae bacterium]|nr:hypothetical protein [Lachnospiraceae bacterium]
MKNIILSCILGSVICMLGGIPVFASSLSSPYVTGENVKTVECFSVPGTDYFRYAKEGTTMQSDYEGEKDTRAICSHSYVPMTISNHSRYSNGGCQTDFKEGQKCKFCGKIVEGKTINTIWLPGTVDMIRLHL